MNTIKIIETVISMLNLLVLTCTLWWAYKSTKETQAMKNESIYQRIIRDAYDIEFKLHPSSAYDLESNTELPFADVKVRNSDLNNIVEFYFLDSDNNPIPRSNNFYRLLSSEGFLEASYYMDLSARKKFLDILNLREGKITAWVRSTNGNKFIYTYQAQTEAYKEAREKQNHHPKGGGPDQFILLSKEVSPRKY